MSEYENAFSHLKEEYEQIPVPDEAKDRVLQAIAQGKKEKYKESRIVLTAKEKWLKMTKFTGGAVAAGFLAITILTNTSAAFANVIEQIPIIGKIAQVVTFRTYEDKQEGFEAKVDIPKVEGENGQEAAVNTEIEKYANELIAAYEKEVKASQGEGHYSLQSTYDVVFENKKYLCIRINTTLVMASGTQLVKVFTVEKATGETVSLLDVLGGSQEKLTQVSENIMQQMETQMKEDEGIVYFYQTDMPETDFTGLTGEESFYFDKNNQLVITFDEYEVAPGYMGAVSFTIPQEVTGNLTK